MGGADISFMIGLAMSGVLYLVLTRNLDRDAEAAAVAALLAVCLTFADHQRQLTTRHYRHSAGLSVGEGR